MGSLAAWLFVDCLKKGGGEAGAGSIYNEAERTCKRAFTLNINHGACWGNPFFPPLQSKTALLSQMKII